MIPRQSQFFDKNGWCGYSTSLSLSTLLDNFTNFTNINNRVAQPTKYWGINKKNKTLGKT